MCELTRRPVQSLTKHNSRWCGEDVVLAKLEPMYAVSIHQDLDGLHRRKPGLGRLRTSQSCGRAGAPKRFLEADEAPA